MIQHIVTRDPGTTAPLDSAPAYQYFSRTQSLDLCLRKNNAGEIKTKAGYGNIILVNVYYVYENENINIIENAR